MDELGPPHPTPPPVCVVVTSPRAFITIDDAVRRRIAAAAPDARFDDENLSFAACAAMTPAERSRQHVEVADRNRAWIDAVFQVTDATWFTVVDGEIASASRDPSSMPADAERWEEGERTDKVSYLFIAQCLTHVDES